MNENLLWLLGLPKGLIDHLLDYNPLAILAYRVQTAKYWQSSPISQRNIIPLWECGTTLTYFDQASATYRRCSLEDINSDWFKYRSLQAVLTRLLIDLYEDELPEVQLLFVAKQIGFGNAEQLLDEARAQNPATYPAWCEAFPLANEAQHLVLPHSSAE